MIDSKYCILIADDEKEIRDIIELLLGSEGYHIITATNGKEVLDQACKDIDLYILDVNMPEITGFMAAAQLRKDYQTPIVFLTAYSGESDKVMGFTVGADDYIVKPFSNIELIMRVKAILRRTGSVSDAKTTEPICPANQVAFQDLLLDLESQSIIKDGEIISLTYTEFKILELLVTHKKKIYSLDNIYQSIWEEDPVGDGAIMVHIKNIRKKLGDNSRSPKYIKTAWGRGYYVE